MLGRLALAAAVAALASPGAAAAHGGGVHQGIQAAVTSVEPPVLGLLADVIGGHERLSIRNRTNKEVVILDGRGEPLLRFTDEGVFRRAAASWRLVDRGTDHAWPDPRIRWPGKLPTAGPTQVQPWRIRGTADGAPFVIRGLVAVTPSAALAATPAEDDGASTAVIVAAVVGGVLALAALALPLRRRKGEDERGETATEP
jgi:hypothetical protein